VVIDVGSGNNTLTAGPGIDRFVFDSTLGSQVDTITNFKPGTDKIVLTATDFTGLGFIGGALVAVDFHLNAPAGGGPQIVYTRSDGFLYYDETGGPLSAGRIISRLSRRIPSSITAISWSWLESETAMETVWVPAKEAGRPASVHPSR
jgi:hypothetical protein